MELVEILLVVCIILLLVMLSMLQRHLIFLRLSKRKLHSTRNAFLEEQKKWTVIFEKAQAQETEEKKLVDELNNITRPFSDETTGEKK